MNDYTLYLVKRAHYKKQLIKQAVSLESSGYGASTRPDIGTLMDNNRNAMDKLKMDLNKKRFLDNGYGASTRPDIGTLMDNNRNAMDKLKQRLSTSNATARKSIQDTFGPKGVVPMGSNPMTFGKQPKVIPGIGPTPIGLDYGK